jgi:hypothetical protein
MPRFVRNIEMVASFVHLSVAVLAHGLPHQVHLQQLSSELSNSNVDPTDCSIIFTISSYLSRFIALINFSFQNRPPGG